METSMMKGRGDTFTDKTSRREKMKTSMMKGRGDIFTEPRKGEGK